ncbi:dihydrodipicolinate synthase family protein [Microlunatus soli]|uniref:4-hydroxy-tetrahydrodipicolinate synthase n=1 Tax=Microlunatus soli TaxID=630515 RepID=A0A1H2ANT0_9ACTN|nr:dihydrodipicolinate synthase family protein [Microlunatus soli]SDT47571.1 4-hydroxy-tetrahydrodipicolinate synthase [Microlunatus soli]
MTTDPAPTDDLLTGVVPVAPTIFTDDEELDLDGQRRVCDHLIDAGVDGICILANYSEQFSLTDAERRAVLETTLDQVAGRVAVCVTTSHFSSRIAAERSREAARLGADMVMLMPPFVGATIQVGGHGVLDYFRTVADGLRVPIMVQDAPMSPTRLPVELITELAGTVEAITHVKVEVPRAAAKISELGRHADVLPGLFDGEEAITLIPDLQAGAVGTMSSSSASRELVDILRSWQSGDRDGAEQQWETLLPLLHYENRQCGPAAAKAILAEGGVIASERTRSPFPGLDEPTRTTLVRLARRRELFALNWA